MSHWALQTNTSITHYIYDIIQPLNDNYLYININVSGSQYTVNVWYLACMIFGGIGIIGYLAWIWIGVLF